MTMWLAHLPRVCARANPETLGETHPAPHLMWQSRLGNLSWLVYRGTISKGILIMEIGKDFVQVRSTANRFALPWPLKGTSFHLCSLGWGFCQAVAGWLK